MEWVSKPHIIITLEMWDTVAAVFGKYNAHINCVAVVMWLRISESQVLHIRGGEQKEREEIFLIWGLHKSIITNKELLNTGVNQGSHKYYSFFASNLSLPFYFRIINHFEHPFLIFHDFKFHLFASNFQLISQAQTTQTPDSQMELHVPN